MNIYLSVLPDVVEHLSNTSEVLVEVVALLDGMLDCLFGTSVCVHHPRDCACGLAHLQDLLILLRVGVLHLLRGLDIISQVIAGAPVGGQAVLEELGDLDWIRISIIVMHRTLKSPQMSGLTSLVSSASSLLLERIGRSFDCLDMLL